MFRDALTPIQVAWLVGLLAVWFVLLFGGFVFAKPALQGDRRMPTWTRIGSSATLVVASLSWFFIVRGSPVSTFAALIALGMTLGFLGDLFVAGLLGVSWHLTAGMAAFGLGHAGYILAFSSLLVRYPPGKPAYCIVVWVGWMLVGVIAWWRVAFRAPRRTRLCWASLPYSLLLTTTAGISTCLALQDPGFALATVGATLFVVSDFILATCLFDRRQRQSRHDVVWLMYGPGQMLIVYSVCVALRATT